MKKILEFNCPEDESEFALANAGVALSIVITDMDNYLRAKVKYEELTETETIIYQNVRDKLRELIIDNGVNEFV